MSPCLHVSEIPTTNGKQNLWKQQLPFFSANGKRKAPGLTFSVWCLHVHASCRHVSTFLEFRKRKTELISLRLFAANGNGKRTTVFLGRQTVNGNQGLLFQETCPYCTVSRLLSAGSSSRGHWAAPLTLNTNLPYGTVQQDTVRLIFLRRILRW